MGAINVKHTGSGAAIALSSDGTSLLLDGIAVGGGGGADLYAANESSPTAQPSATGANAVAIGEAAVASGVDSIAIGTGAEAFGERGLALGNYSHSRVSGYSSTAIQIQRASTSYGALGSYDFAVGNSAKTTNSYAGVFAGSANISSGRGSVCIGGDQNEASGWYSIASGYLSTASGIASYASGMQSVSNIDGKKAHASWRFANDGDAQTGLFSLHKATTDATPAPLLTGWTATPGTTNQVVLPNNSVYGFTGTIIARENSAQTNDFAVWEVKGGAVRATGVATTALGSYNINKISESTGAAAWAIGISADTTNGAIAFTVTGEASHSIRWVATINTTEVTY
tara:strand:- start:894 stop:1919 length:1026 start_codon:yes stop_codon:yes gene_type:complete